MSSVDNVLLALDALRKSMGDDKDFNKADEKFVREMISHHQMAVDMATVVLSKGMNNEVIRLAKGIKSAQQDEIKIMKKWLKDRGLKESGGGM